jgi:tyramine---L-glutamate ligase
LLNVHRLFLAEFATSGALPGIDLPDSIHREGLAMLLTLAEDASRLGSIRPVVALRSAELLARGEMLPVGVEWKAVESVEQWPAIAATCDSALIIAPEDDGLLQASLSQLARVPDLRLIASSDAFQRTADCKWMTAQCLRAREVPHPQTWLFDEAPDPRTVGPLVAKPRGRCGSTGVVRCETRRELDTYATRFDPSDSIVQSWQVGVPASLVAIVGRAGRCFLPAMSQNLDPDTFTYRGGFGPLPPDVQQRGEQLANRTLDAMPEGAMGWIGIDMILGPPRDVVIEVNARITSSYVGLRRVVHQNLVEQLMRSARGERAEAQPNGREVRFTVTL